MATTNNIKILNKDYLAEQLYNYHKKYVASSINGIESNKQNNLEVVSNHLTWENNNILGVNISNDSEANKNDYLVLENKENGSLSWKTPITEQEKLEGSEFLVTGKAVFNELTEYLKNTRAVFNFVGSTNINTLGTIKEGTWEVGDITLNEHNLTVNEGGKIIVGNFEINQENEVLKIKYADSYLTLDSSGELHTKSINVDTRITTDEAKIFNLTIGDSIKIGDFEIRKFEEENLKIGSEASFLTLSPSGELNTASITTEEADISNLNTDSIKIRNSDFEIKQQEEGRLQIGSEFLTIDSSGELKTTNVNTETITTTDLTVKGSYFMLGNVMCSLAKESEFNIDSITKSES